VKVSSNARSLRKCHIIVFLEKKMHATITKTSIFALVFAVCGSIATAQDWSGAYVGIQAGQTNGEIGGEAELGDISLDLDGSFASVRAGYDYSFDGGVVAGLVVDYSGGGATGSLCVETQGNDCDNLRVDTSYLNSEIGTSFGIRGRAGWTSGNVLFYGTAGVAISEVSTELTYLTSSTDAPAVSNETMVGLSLGVGAEVHTDNNVSYGIELLDTSYNEKSTNLVGSSYGPVPTSSELSTKTVNIFINYHF
jgi:outer membrane immunogenic protein